MNRIGPKPLDVVGVIEHLGRALAPRGRPRDGNDVRSGGPSDLRAELVRLFSDIDEADPDGLRRARKGALPLIIRDALGERASEGELAHAVESIDQLFETDERLSALLVRAVASIRG